MPQKLTTTACFIQEESSGGKQFRKKVSCFYAQGGNVQNFQRPKFSIGTQLRSVTVV